MNPVPAASTVTPAITVEPGGPEGDVLIVARDIPAVVALRAFAGVGATMRTPWCWTIGARQGAGALEQARERLTEWLASGRPDPTLPRGRHGGIEVVDTDPDGYRLKAAPPHMPALERLGAVRIGPHWQLPWAAHDALVKLATSTAASTDAARAAPFSIEGFDVRIEDNGTLAIAAPYDPAIVAALSAVPTARWDRRRRCWTVSVRYRNAARRAMLMLAPKAQTLAEERASAAAPLIARLARLPGITVTSNRITANVPFNPAFNAAAKAHGLRWQPENRSWSGPLPARDNRLTALVETFEGALAEANGPSEPQGPRQPPTQPAKPAVTTADPRPQRPGLSIVLPTTTAIDTSRPIEWRSHRWRILRRVGPFRIDADMPSYEGEHLLGHEGDLAWRYFVERIADESPD